MEHIQAYHYLSASSIPKYPGASVDTGIEEHGNHKNRPEFH
jgi:hypothetical protein